MNDSMHFEALDVEVRDRFTMIYDDVWQVLKGKSSLSVYMAIKRRTNPDSPQWFGHRKELAAEAGLSVNTFIRGIQELEELGLIKVVHRFVPANWDKKDTSKVAQHRDAEHPVQIGNLYLIRFHLPVNSGSTPRPNSGLTPRPKSGLTPRPKIGSQTYNPLDIDPLDIDTSKDMLIPDGKSDNASLPIDGIDAPGNETPSSQKKTGAEKYPEDFLEWYGIYPRKKAKGDALKAYRAAMKEIDHSELMEKTRKFVRFVEQSQMEQMYIPYPATWLRASRWEDELEPETPRTAPGSHADGRKVSALDIVRGMIAKDTHGQNGATPHNAGHKELDW